METEIRLYGKQYREHCGYCDVGAGHSFGIGSEKMR